MTPEEATRPAGGTARAVARDRNELKQFDCTPPDTPSATFQPAPRPILRPPVRDQLRALGLDSAGAVHETADGRIVVSLCSHVRAVIDYPAVRFYVAGVRR